MQKKISWHFSKIMAFAMVLIMVLVSLPVSAYAAENDSDAQGSEQITVARSGVEVLPYGSYEIGNFTFTDCNYTPVKTVEGSVISLSLLFKKASIDQGTGPVKLTIQICDENCNPISPKWTYSMSENSVMMGATTPDFDLGYAGRKIRIFTDASSVGASNGHYRSITFDYFGSYVK